MKENISKNILLTLTLTVLATALSLAMNKYLLDIIGKEELGLYRLLSQVVFYLSLLDLGISTSATVAYYKPLANKDNEKVSIIYNTIRVFYNKVAIVTVILGLVLLPFLIYLVDFSSNLNLSIYWLIFVVSTAANFLLNKYIILFLADQKVFFVKALTGLVLVFEKTLQIALLIFLESFVLFISVSILSSIIKYFFLRKKFLIKYYVNSREHRIEKRIKSDAGQMFFHKLSHIVLYNTDNIIIAKFISLSVVASYSSYIMLVTLIITVVSIFHSVVDPIVGQLVAKMDSTENYEIWQLLFRVSFWIVGFVSIGFYFFATPFIHVWLGSELTLSNLVIIIIAFNLFFDIIKWPIEIIKYKYAYFKDIYNPILEVLVNLSFSLLLVNYFGLVGVVIGTLIVNVMSNLIVKPLIVFSYCFKVSIINYIRVLFFSSLELTFISLAVFFIEYHFKLFSFGSAYSWLDIVKNISVFSMIYFGVWIVSICIFGSKLTLSKLVFFIKTKRIYNA